MGIATRIHWNGGIQISLFQHPAHHPMDVVEIGIVGRCLCDQNQVHARFQFRFVQAERLIQPTPDVISAHSFAYFFTHSDAQAVACRGIGQYIQDKIGGVKAFPSIIETLEQGILV